MKDEIKNITIEELQNSAKSVMKKPLEIELLKRIRQSNPGEHNEGTDSSVNPELLELYTFTTDNKVKDLCEGMIIMSIHNDMSTATTAAVSDLTMQLVNKDSDDKWEGVARLISLERVRQGLLSKEALNTVNAAAQKDGQNEIIELILTVTTVKGLTDVTDLDNISALAESMLSDGAKKARRLWIEESGSKGIVTEKPEGNEGQDPSSAPQDNVPSLT